MFGSFEVEVEVFGSLIVRIHVVCLFKTKSSFCTSKTLVFFAFTSPPRIVFCFEFERVGIELSRARTCGIDSCGVIQIKFLYVENRLEKRIEWLSSGEFAR